MELTEFRELNARERALASIAVLLDGREAATYLIRDSIAGATLGKAATALAIHPPELRMPLAGTMLRLALEEMGG